MKKIKEVLGVDQRISLFQTAMNNAGRNFEGKKVNVKVMAKFAEEFYKLAIKEIEEIGKMSTNDLKSIAEMKLTKKEKKYYICKKCKKGRLTKQEYDYSLKVYKNAVCRNCQQKKTK